MTTATLAWDSQAEAHKFDLLRASVVGSGVIRLAIREAEARARCAGRRMVMVEDFLGACKAEKMPTALVRWAHLARAAEDAT